MLVSIVMSKYFYILFLCLSVLGLFWADYHYKIAFYKNRDATIKTIGIVMILLLLFDVLGIINNVFTTNQRYVTGLYIISKNLPVEEFIFLFLLCYFCLVLYLLINNKLRSKRHHNV
jgi:lycopene cyclase domain-containing protein